MVQHLVGQDLALIGPQEPPDLHVVSSEKVCQRGDPLPRIQVESSRFRRYASR